jgi:hypothetical protein
MPLTPAALRPIARTSSSMKEQTLPLLDGKRDDRRAIRPFDIEELVAFAETKRPFAVLVIEANSVSLVRFTTPLTVAKKRKSLSG